MPHLFQNFILLLASLYHLAAGIFVLGPKTWAQYFAKNLYSLNIPIEYEPRYEVTLKFLGAMAVSLAVLLGLILLKGNGILKTYTLITLGLLFILRACLRIQLKQTIFDAYQLSYQRSMINIVFNISIGLITLLVAFLNFRSGYDQ
jgi:hypothetical protein